MFGTKSCTRLWAPKKNLFWAPSFLTFTLLVLILCLLGYWGFNTKFLVIKDNKSGAVGWAARINESENFVIRYIHSVDRLPVFEFYKVKNQKLVLTGTKVINFGVGLGYIGEGKICTAGKWTFIKNMDRQIGSLPLRVGTVADHTLLYRGREIHLKDYFSGLTLVRLEVQNVFQVMFNRVRGEIKDVFKKP